MRAFSVVLHFTLLLIGLGALSAAEKPLNVVFILTDNHGAWTLGCYGNPDIETPHIDRLASEGVRFTRAYANNGVCSPTRATYLTGLMPSQHGVHNFLRGGRLQTGPEARNTLDAFRSLPEVLSDRGYSCGLVGKWHLGDNLHPQEGLDDYWITMPHGGTQTFHGAKIIENGEIRTEEEHLTTFWTRHAVNFLEQNAKKEDPFFLFLSFNGPYGLSRFQIEPLRGPRAADYADADIQSFPGGVIHPWEYNNREYFGNPTAIRRYAAELSAVDDGVGEVMSTLERLGVAENTLVVFCADQGWAGGQHGFWGMGDHTRPLNAFDYSMQIPMIFHHPSGIPGGRTPDIMVSNYDFMPSMLGYLGMDTEMPKAPLSPGRDFSALLKGDEPKDWENEVFFEHENLRCIRTDRWKYIERYDGGHMELYDLEADPEELVNLAKSEEVAAARAKLKTRLDAFFEDHAEPEYDLWKGGGAQTALFVWGEEAKAREEARAKTGLARTVFDLDFNPPPFDLPTGYVAEVVAAPPLVEHPMMATFDDRGRLFVAEAAGVNLKPEELEKELPNYVRMLEDSNGDGFFDKTTIFADNMTFPQGALWLDGALYVASPPGIWKLVDHDDDGVADGRTEIVTGFEYTGNAADVHGPFLHPNGRIYWCHGRKGHEVRQQDGTMVSANKGARIWSCKPDGSDIQVHAGGGMDNPVEIDFTPEGEIIGSVNLFYGRPRGDTLVHWIKGGRYPRYDQGAVLEEFKITGDPLTELHNFGHVAVSGMTRTSSGEIFTTLFNTQELLRTEIRAEGSTFAATSTESFLKIQNPDVHLTDVLEDADGSLLVIDTGGWFRIGCPTSQLAKPEIPGAIYRIRKAGPHDTKTDWRGAEIAWTQSPPADIAALLDDERPAVRERAIQELAGRKNQSIPVLKRTLAAGSEMARRNAIWALTRIDSPVSLGVVRQALQHQPISVIHAACNSISSTGDPKAASALIKLTRSGDPGLRRAAITALGSTKDPAGVRWIADALESPGDRFTEHAGIYALIEADKFAQTKALKPKAPEAKGRVMLALDQMDSSQLAAKDILPLLGNKAMTATAVDIASRHPDWAPEIAAHFEKQLEKTAALESLSQVAPGMLSAAEMRGLVANLLVGSAKQQQVALEVIANSPSVLPLPKAWESALGKLLADAKGERLNQVLRALNQLDSAAYEKPLQAIAANDKLPIRTRFLALRAGQSGDVLTPAGFGLLLQMLGPEAASADRAEAVGLLSQARLTKPQLLDLAGVLRNAGPVEFLPILTAFARSRDAEVGTAVAEAVAASSASSSVPVSEIRRYLSRYPVESIAPAEEKLAELERSERQRLDLLESLTARVETEGDSAKGAQIFQSGLGTCIHCHRIGDQGKQVGPDLTTIGKIRSSRDLLESVLFPGASIARDFEAYLITMQDGAIHTGVIQHEDSKVLRIAAMGGLTMDLDRKAVKSMKAAPSSLMPLGLHLTLSEQQLLDLVAYLDQLE